MIKTKTIEIKYTWFNPGDCVKIKTWGLPMDLELPISTNEGYVVLECLEPIGREEALLRLQGVPRLLPSWYFVEVDEDDLSWGLNSPPFASWKPFIRASF